MKKYTLPIVHLVDTEGPFFEPIEETFDQLKNFYNINIKPTKENLSKIQKGDLVPSKYRNQIMKRFSKHRITYNKSWSDIDKMCEKLFSKEWRYDLTKNKNNPYQINWNCLDQIGLIHNSRRRQLGPNIIYKYYENQINNNKLHWDRLYWHYHPIAFSQNNIRTGTSLNFYPLHYKSLCYRIIDCLNFPSVFRPGFHIERTDLNLFLEQWIPFDYGNQNSNDDRPTNSGRFHNWDGATKEWEVYNPSIKDPRKPGALSRSIARTLNIGTDFNCLTEDEIYKAFKRCQKGLPTILAYTDHDHRDMVSEIEDVVAKILYIHGEFKEHIDLKFTNAVDAMRLYRNIKEEKPIEFNVSLKNNILYVNTNKRLFGSQPFLAIKTYDERYLHDNFCFGEDDYSFFYQFDKDSIPVEVVEKVGIASNDMTGNSTVYVLDIKNDNLLKKYFTS